LTVVAVAVLREVEVERVKSLAGVVAGRLGAGLGAEGRRNSELGRRGH